MEMKSSTENNSKGWITPLIPPIVLHLYRGLRYGDAYYEAVAERERKAAIIRNTEFTLPSRTLAELFPGVESQLVTAPVSQIYRARDMVVPLAELLTLAAICRHLQPRRVFEIGTYTGSSTLVMAINLAAQAEIFTLDLEPSELVGSIYRGTSHASKIRELYGNSLEFDYEPFRGSVDLVLVDANHAYDFVKADTEKAFALLRPGGVIIWDDYRWLDVHSECSGVTLCLNELQKTRPIYSLAGTRFAIYVDNEPANDRQT